jgi:hypothetical protein
MQGDPCLLAPPSTSVFAVDGSLGQWSALGQIYAVAGERQTPKRALIKVIDGAPLALRRGRTVVLNADPFAAYQAWLQGHDDLSPWLCWHDRLMWIDAQAISLARLLDDIFPEVLASIPRISFRNLPDKVAVLRHDLDSSRDTSFLDDELAAEVPATHAILDDRNSSFWIGKLAEHVHHEAAFHYDTARRASLLDRLRAKTSSMLPVPIRASGRRIGGGGLERQLRRIMSKGLRPPTLLRHLSFIYYPEWIDALDYAFERYGISGGSSFFRGRVLRFGEHPDGPSVGTCYPPDVQFPVWFPFRAYHAGKDRLSMAFEGTSLIEPEPELVHQLLETPWSRPLKRVVTICFHPAHAHSDTITPGGTRQWLRAVIQAGKRHSWPFRSLASVYRECEDARRSFSQGTT